jgi:hypothetical protein
VLALVVVVGSWGRAVALLPLLLLIAVAEVGAVITTQGETPAPLALQIITAVVVAVQQGLAPALLTAAPPQALMVLLPVVGLLAVGPI